jgi:hypothetical protein
VAAAALFYTGLFWRLLSFQERPDLILTLTTPPFVGLLAKAASLRFRCRRVHWVMDLYPDALAAHGLVRPGSFFYGMLRRLARFQYRGAEGVLCLGPLMKRRVDPYLVGASSKSTWISIWGPDQLKRFQRVRVSAARRPEDLTLTYAGNMGMGHEFGTFLRASSVLGPRGPRWRFVGGGKRFREIEAFAAKNPQARVDVAPYVPPDRARELREILMGADVHLISMLPSWQGLMIPTKLPSVFSLGKPVLFVGGEDNEVALSLRESGAGWVVGVGDVSGLLKALREAASPAERAKRGRAALIYGKRHFSPEKNIGEICTFLGA